MSDQHGISIDSTSHVNSLFWISSLEESERGSTRRVHEDLIPFLKQIGCPYQEFVASSSAALLQFLDELAIAAKDGAKPIIHFDTHGNAQDGIWIVGSQDFVSWEVLVEKLRAINVACDNNLCVISCACFGLFMIKPVRITDTTPFNILIAPETGITFKVVEQSTFIFYQDLFNGLNVTDAFDKHLRPTFKMFHCQKMFLGSIARYIRHNCMGRGLDVRTEELLSAAIAQRANCNTKDRRALRATIKTQLKPSQELIDKYADKFLIGKPSGLQLDQLQDFIKGAIKQEDRLKSRDRRSQARLRRGPKT